MNILIVDDNEFDAFDLSTKLAKISPAACTLWRASPEAALEEITGREAHYFDIVFVDQHMPGCLGTDFVADIGPVSQRKVSRVVMLTSDGGDATRAKALVSDCSGFLTKPVDFRRLGDFVTGQGCHWKTSDLPRNIEHYWDLKERVNDPS